MSGRHILSLAALLSAFSALATAQGVAHKDDTLLDPPALPNPRPTSVDVSLPTNPAGLSRVQKGDFMGFSVEMSVSNQILGRTLQKVETPFINLLAQIRKRGGGVTVRVGGNSQERATIANNIATGQIIYKGSSDPNKPTETPQIFYNRQLIDLMAKISSYTNAGWYLGIPFDPTPNLEIVKLAPPILGDHLIAFQAANQPDYYAGHGVRGDNYNAKSYFDEVGRLIESMKAENLRTDDYLVAPSISLTKWEMEDVWNTGFVPAYKDQLAALSAERYLSTNCAKVGAAKPVDSQNLFNTMLQHPSAVDWVAPYYPSTALALENGKPFVMMEFNTATCSGLPGLSNSFGAAMWIADTGLQMAYANFTGALLHVGGQDSYYNPFTAPDYDGGKSGSKWTVGPTYYSAILLAEALGASNKSQVLDLNTGAHTPSYGIYENGAPTRVVLFNYMTDKSGASDATMSVKVPAGISNVKVKYLRAESVSSKVPFQWAGQTWGDSLQSNGLPTGNLDVQSVSCEASTCAIKVPAPAIALVFLTDKALEDSTSGPDLTFTSSDSVSSSTSKSASGAKATPTKKTTSGHTSPEDDENGALAGRVGMVMMLGSAFLAGMVLVL